jgi:aspartate/methionine/tyrosine aminotransferase
VRIDLFEMERLQSLYWHEVEYDLSESGVRPMMVEELLSLGSEDEGDVDAFLRTALGYPLSEGSDLTRERIAAWYPGATVDNVTVVNGGSEANLLSLWTLLETERRLAFMVPNYMQGWGLGRHFGEATDTFSIRLQEHSTGVGWALDLDGMERAVRPDTGVVMVCNPNNPTGHVLTEAEMEAVVHVAREAGAWLVCDEIYRGAEVDTDEATPTFWGRYEKVVVTSGLSKAFAMPGLRIGWVVGPEGFVRDLWAHHDYTTLTPGMVSDRLCSLAMEPSTRERILARTRRIIRENLPPLEEWIATHADVFRYARPIAGAIAFVESDMSIASAELVERIRREQSVLLVPGEMFGGDQGLRIGFGFDIEQTMKGLARVDETFRGL